MFVHHGVHGGGHNYWSPLDCLDVPCPDHAGQQVVAETSGHLGQSVCGERCDQKDTRYLA
jgi:hypothetical protein